MTTSPPGTTTCPVCGAPGRLDVFAPTGHLVVVHEGALCPDGAQLADTACVVPRDVTAARSRRRATLRELTRLSEEMGLYDPPEETS